MKVRKLSTKYNKYREYQDIMTNLKFDALNYECRSLSNCGTNKMFGCWLSTRGDYFETGEWLLYSTSCINHWHNNFCLSFFLLFFLVVFLGAFRVQNHLEAIPEFRADRHISSSNCRLSRDSEGTQYKRWLYLQATGHTFRNGGLLKKVIQYCTSYSILWS